MSRLLRLLVAGGVLATSALSSLTACAEGAPPKGAVAPTSQATTQETAVTPNDATPGPLPPAGDAPASNEAQPASAEPPSPSEYDVSADTDPAALTDFRETLDPYGAWEDDSTYGTVWVPASTVVGAEFTPYVTHGHWGLTGGNSWIWVSDFSWGWAPFHYGRWVWIGGRGWAWIPGRVYSPAWVVWRTGYYDDWYVGWAPMPPVWYWHGGYAASLWYVPPAPYVFCSSRYVFSPRVRGYIVPSERVGFIAPRTRPYIAATATVASSSTYRVAAAARGPSISDAHVPADAMPSTRVSHDARAMSFAQATARPIQGRTLSSAQPAAVQSSMFSRPPATAPRPFSRAPLPPTATTQPAEVPRPMSPSTPGRTFSNAPGPLPPTAVRPVSPAPRPFSPGPAPVAPRSFSPGPAPVAPRPFSPPAAAPIAPRSFTPAPAPAAPSFSRPAVRSSAPAPAAGRSFGGHR